MTDSRMAAVRLGLKVSDYHESDVLARNVFHVNRWPQTFRDRYDCRRSRQDQAQVAVEYIDWFCEKYGPKKESPSEPKKEETWRDRGPLL